MTDTQRRFKSIGLLLLTVALLSGAFAWEQFRAAQRAAATASELVEGITFTASIPTLSYLAGFLAVLSGVAAVRCLTAAWSARDSQHTRLQ